MMNGEDSFEGFEDLFKHLKQLVDKDAGLGKLRIHEHISSFVFEKRLQTMLNE